MQTLAKAGELSLKLPRDARKDKLSRSVKVLAPSASEASTASAPTPSRALSIVARNDPDAAAFIDKFTKQHCKRDVSDEWKVVDDAKLDTLRGILAALKEDNQATQLLKHESADREAGQELEATRSNVKQRLRACKEQEGLFEEKQRNLKRHVMDNEKSLRLMDANIEKGERMVKEEAAECKRLDLEIRAAEREIEEHEHEQLEEERQIAKAMEFKAFLEGVVQVEHDFDGDIKVLMNRYHTLNAEKQSLHQRNAFLATQLSEVRETYQKIQADMQTEHMVSSSRLHEAQVELERYRAECKELEERVNRDSEERELKKSQVGIILMAIDQIFTRIVQSCRLKPRKDAMLAEVEEKKFVPVRSDRESARLEAMLNQIIARVGDLREMSDKVRASIDRERKPVVSAVVEEGNFADRVQFHQHRDPPDRLLGEGPSSSHPSSELVGGATTSSKHAGR